MTHTPGPWAVELGQSCVHAEEGDDDFAQPGGGFTICMGGLERLGSGRGIWRIDYAADMWPGDRGYDEAHDNARLIASAPDLLRALQKLTEHLWTYEHTAATMLPLLNAADEALAKATEPETPAEETSHG